MKQSILTPFQHHLFRAMWIAMFISNIGTWMSEVGAAWLMASLSSSNLMVALLQTATTLPFFFLAYPAGTMADIFDRRHLLLALHIWMFSMALLLAFCTYYDVITSWLLLLFTFSLGIGNAMMRPAWAASVPSFVPREQLQNAVTLNSMSTNVSRAIGPALGGVILFLASPEAVFLLNAISFTGLIVVLYFWQNPSTNAHSTLPVERFFGAFKAGLRYASNVPELRSLLIRSIILFFFASSVWSLLPVIAIRLLQTDANGYGAMMASIGFGAILGAAMLPQLGQKLSRNAIILLASLLLTVCFISISFSRDIYLLGSILVLFGAAWIWVFSVIVVAVQFSLPDWVRARGLAIVMLTFGGSMAAGSALWGYLSDLYGIPVTLAGAAIGLFLSTLLLHKRYHIQENSNQDLTPSTQWMAPEFTSAPKPHHGPVMITVEYEIAKENVDEFMSLMEETSRARKRDGAFFWEVFNTVSQPGHYIETYMVESWLEYLRQHERSTLHDQSIVIQLVALNKNGQPPVVKHMIAGKEKFLIE